MAIRVGFGIALMVWVIVFANWGKVIGPIILAILLPYILWPVVVFLYRWGRRQVREYLEFRRAEQRRLLRQVPDGHD